MNKIQMLKEWVRPLLNTRHFPSFGSVFLSISIVYTAVWSSGLPKNTQCNLSLNSYSKVGAGQMKWFGVKLYHATLSSQQGSLSSIPDTAQDVLLNIVYNVDVKQAKLLYHTESEWADLQIIPQSRSQIWLKQLSSIWPNVNSGDSIQTLVVKDQTTCYYHNSKFIGQIDDKEFGANFLSIWLSQNTSEPKLRAKLLGKTE